MRRGHGARASVRLHNDPDCAFAHPTGALSDEIMRMRSPKDFWAGLIFIAIGGGFILLAQQYRLGDMHRMGPAMFPTLVGALLAALGLIIALRSFALDAARDVRPLENLALAAALVAFSVGVFVWLLGLPLPLWPTS